MTELPMNEILKTLIYYEAIKVKYGRQVRSIEEASTFLQKEFELGVHNVKELRSQARNGSLTMCVCVCACVCVCLYMILTCVFVCVCVCVLAYDTNLCVCCCCCCLSIYLSTSLIIIIL